MNSNRKVTAAVIFALLIFVGLYCVISFKHACKHSLYKCYDKTELSSDLSAQISETEKILHDKIKRIEVKCLSFNGEEKNISLDVIDVAANDVIEIFRELKKIRFPVYASSCYAPKTTVNGKKISLHAYAAAIDINYLMNPYFNVIKGVMIPTRNKDRYKDAETIKNELREIKIAEEEIKSVLKTAIQPKGSDDRFLNRGVIRKGMVTQKIVNIFRKHGFNIWGGKWRQPLDYMHFQIPRPLAEQLMKSNLEERQRIWENHKKAILNHAKKPGKNIKKVRIKLRSTNLEASALSLRF